MPTKPPAHTCPWIDQLQTLVRRHVRGPDRRRALELLEQLRGANLQLRVAYADAVAAAPEQGRTGGGGAAPVGERDAG